MGIDRICVSMAGEPVSLKVLRPSAAAVDAQVPRDVALWRWHPYVVDGMPTPLLQREIYRALRENAHRAPVSGCDFAPFPPFLPHNGLYGGLKYVGITNNLARRAAEHLAGSGIQIEKLMGGLSRGDARAVEQALIEINGLGKNGGTLLNRINSIAASNPAYAQQVQRGYELLQSIGY